MDAPITVVCAGPCRGVFAEAELGIGADKVRICPSCRMKVGMASPPREPREAALLDALRDVERRLRITTFNQPPRTVAAVMVDTWPYLESTRGGLVAAMRNYFGREVVDDAAAPWSARAAESSNG